MKTANRSVLYFLLMMVIFLPTALGQKKQSNKELAAEVEKWKQAAEEATARAAKAEENAQRMAQIVVASQREAEISQAKAEKAEAAASRARYIAQAKAMALKSTELRGDPEQQALMSLQAYKFNLKYDRNPNDNDIYNGLRQALLGVNSASTKNLEGGDVTVLISDTRDNIIYSGGVDGTILKWTKGDSGWTSERIVGARKNVSVFAMALSPDGSLLAVAEGTASESKNHYLAVYDLKTPGNGARKISGFSRIKSIIYLPQGDRAYVFEADSKSIKLTDFKEVHEVVKPKEQIKVVALSMDGNTLAGGSASGKVYLWNSADNFLESILYQGESAIATLTFAPDRNRILIGDSQGRILIKAMGSTIPPRVLAGHTGPVTQIVFNNAGTFVASVADDGIRIWNWVRQSDPPIVLKYNKKNVSPSATFSRDDEQIFVSYAGDPKESITVWPTKMSTMSQSLCSSISRNMTKEEWENFAGSDLPYEQTCDNFPRNNN